ncbi:MAG: hypothetical protein JWN30_2199 [Bacilli bacterium]|nr:hypothetical protein [Bacilli bacterium]
MHLLKVNQLKKQFSDRILFEHVSVGIAHGDKIGLIGENGVGKTTLFNLLIGAEKPDEGEVQWQLGFDKERIGFLTQQLTIHPGETMQTYIRRGKTELHNVERELRLLEQHLASEFNASNEELLSQYGTLQETFEKLGGYELDHQVERVLKEVQLDEHLWQIELAHASGGQKTKVQLARILLQQPDLLLLDEPTNHLDHETMDWLREFLLQFTGTVLIVSHDRFFLDQVVSRILELTPTGIASYTGNYTAYKQAREIELRTQQAAFQKQQTEIQQLEEAIQTFQTWFHRAHRTAGQNDFARSAAKTHVTRMRNKERQLERIREHKIEPLREPSTLSVKYDTHDKIGNQLLKLEGISVRFGQHDLFRDVSVTVKRGDKIALIGQNGSGKSTLLKIIMGEQLPAAGVVRTNPGVRIGYFGQELDRLDPNHTILQEILQVDGVRQTNARTILSCFLFRGEDVFKPIRSLSQGEKCRVAFVKLYFSGANILILDEPTNYLDIPSRERIESALVQFPGTILLVSHDLYMVQRLATQLLLFKEGTILHFDGTYRDWLDLQAKRTLPEECRQREEQRLILQMELSRWAEKVDNTHTSKEEREQAMDQLNVVQGKLKLLN